VIIEESAHHIAMRDGIVEQKLMRRSYEPVARLIERPGTESRPDLVPDPAAWRRLFGHRGLALDEVPQV
jgi:hypothetical protein